VLDASDAEGDRGCHCLSDLAPASGVAGHTRRAACPRRMGARRSISMSIALQMEVQALKQQVAEQGSRVAELETKLAQLTQGLDNLKMSFRQPREKLTLKRAD